MRKQHFVRYVLCPKRDLQLSYATLHSCSGRTSSCMGLRSARATAILLPLGMLFRFETLFVTDSPSTHPLLVPRRPLGSAFPR